MPERHEYTHSMHLIPLWVQLADGSAHTNLPGTWKLWDPGNNEEIIKGVTHECTSFHFRKFPPPWAHSSVSAWVLSVSHTYLLQHFTIDSLQAREWVRCL